MRLASFGLTVDRLFARSLNVPTRHRPTNPRLGVRVWPGLDKPNPYPYPAVPGQVQQPVTIPMGRCGVVPIPTPLLFVAVNQPTDQQSDHAGHALYLVDPLISAAVFV